ncbi:MAG: portal protein [Bacteroidales bacterium]|nr:portal protein [Bacteroidales bacterium]
MANRSIIPYTVFQRLAHVLGGTTTGVPSQPQRQYNISHDAIIGTASSREEFDAKVLQAKQQKLLSQQWKRTQYDLANNSLASLNDLKLMYRDADLMDCFPEIGTSMDIVSEEVCPAGEDGNVLNVYSKSERVRSILEDLFINRLTINVTLPMIARAMYKYGNEFMLHNISETRGILGWKELPTYEIERYENGMQYPYTMPNTPNNKFVEGDTKFVWVGSSQNLCYRNFQIAHFRLLYDSSHLPYGCSGLNKARRHFRMLSMMEDMMLIYRLDRSVERRVYKVNVGNIDTKDIPAFIEDFSNKIKRTPIIDPLTGQVDLRKNIMTQLEDFVIPVYPGQDYTPIETLSAGQNLTAMDDIKFIQDKIVTALRIPKAFLNFEESTGEGKNLSLLDVRFSKTVNRIQQALLMELNKVAMIHLTLLGFTDEVTNFRLTMNNSSSQAEMLELENLAKKITTARDAVSDPGGGIPIASMTWAWKHIMKWSDKEIKQNLEELRLETALAMELQKTGQIIDRTGLFDPVDNIYGEPGAEYSEASQGGENGPGGGPQGGGGGGGMPPMGGAELDFGEGEEAMGEEGEMPMEAAAQEGQNGAPEEGNPSLGEMVSRSLSKKIEGAKKKNINEQRKKKEHWRELYFNRLTERLISAGKEEKKQENVPIYDRGFLINEEINSLSDALDDFINNRVNLND